MWVVHNSAWLKVLRYTSRSNIIACMPLQPIFSPLSCQNLWTESNLISCYSSKTIVREIKGNTALYVKLLKSEIKAAGCCLSVVSYKSKVWMLSADIYSFCGFMNYLSHLCHPNGFHQSTNCCKPENVSLCRENVFQVICPLIIFNWFWVWSQSPVGGIRTSLISCDMGQRWITI